MKTIVRVTERNVELLVYLADEPIKAGHEFRGHFFEDNCDRLVTNVSRVNDDGRMTAEVVKW